MRDWWEANALAEFVAATGGSDWPWIASGVVALGGEAGQAAALLVAVGCGWGLSRRCFNAPARAHAPGALIGEDAELMVARCAASEPQECGLSRLHAEVRAIRAAERILLRITPEDVMTSHGPRKPDAPG